MMPSFYSNTPTTMLTETSQYASTMTLRHRTSDDFMDLLLEDCDVSTKTCANDLKSSSNDSQDEFTEISMNSISLDDTEHLMHVDYNHQADNTPAPYGGLFDHKLQRYEWNDDFSMLLRLKTCRLTTIVEEEGSSMFSSPTAVTA